MNQPLQHRSLAWILAAVCATPLVAQSAAGSAALVVPEQAVQKATNAWRLLARDLDTRVARMLPCDPRAQQAIEETSRASQSRLTALAEYYQTASAIAATRTEGAKRLLAKEQVRATEVADDIKEAREVLAAAEKQAADLDASARQQSALGGALAALRQAVETTRQRGNVAKDQDNRFKTLLPALARLVQAYEAREVALADAIKAFDAERTRWNAYYAARLARAQLECSVTNPAPAAAKPKLAAPKPAAPKPAKPKPVKAAAIKPVTKTAAKAAAATAEEPVQ
jgi:hypothetical protein